MNLNPASLLVAMSFLAGAFPAAAVQEVRAKADAEPVKDVTPPAGTGDLAAVADGNAVTLTWTSAGDDGMSGRPSPYDIRCAEASIDDATWDAATWIGFFPGTVIGGSYNGVIVDGLDPFTTYYFALKTLDNVSLESPLSNAASTTTGADTTAPGAITSLREVKGSATTTSLEVTWTVPSNPWGSGVTGYDMRWCPTENGDVTVSWDDPGTTAVVGEPLMPKSDGEQEVMPIFGLSPGMTYSIAVRARDAAGNWSSLPYQGSIVGTLQPPPPEFVPPEAKGSGGFKAMNCAASGASAGWTCLLPLALLGLRRIGG